VSLTVLASEIDWSKPLPPAKERGYVYFMQAQESLRVKIGYARDPTARLQMVRTHCPEPVGLTGAIPHPNPSWLEADIHKHFAALRLHGEWFESSPEMVEWVERHALTGDDLVAELYPEERPEGWQRPHRPRPQFG
jgi:hypothetical protein